jgi:hypothetical protein
MTGARDTGSTIAFGFKVTQYANHNFDDNIGYHFLEMELACRDPDTGKLGRQLIIAVKMPPRRPVSQYISLISTLYLRPYPPLSYNPLQL